MRWGPWPALLASLALGAPACGANEEEGEPRLVVSAAASMTEALQGCSASFGGADVRLSFGGSDKLAAQIRQGIVPDVYVAANTELPRRLSEAGLLERPVRFASNELVVAVPRQSRIHSIEGLARQGVTLAIGSESVPIGAYTRQLLSRLPGRTGKALLANVRSEEPEVKGVVGKLTQRAVDAGVIYRSDLHAARRLLRAVRLPEGLQPSVVYAAGVVRGARQPERARRYVDGLAHGACHDALRAAGFEPPR